MNYTIIQYKKSNTFYYEIIKILDSYLSVAPF